MTCFLSLFAGVLATVSSLAAESGPKVESFWIDGYRSDRASEASHFILQGSGTLSARIFAVAQAVDSIATAEAMRSMTMSFSRFNGVEWELMATVDLDMTDHFDESEQALGARMGELDIELGAGSYLAQFMVPTGLSVSTTLQVELENAADLISPRLVNASVLGYVGGSRLKREIGFSLSGGGERELLVRNVGPTLENYGLSAVASNPALMLMRDGLKLASNDNWWSQISISSDQVRSAMQLMGAFQLNDKSSDSAIKIDSDSGAYQVISRAKSSKGGYEMVEVYLD